MSKWDLAQRGVVIVKWVFRATGARASTVVLIAFIIERTVVASLGGSGRRRECRV
jgi:hypothetical protein